MIEITAVFKFDETDFTHFGKLHNGALFIWPEGGRNLIYQKFKEVKSKIGWAMAINHPSMAPMMFPSESAVVYPRRF